MFIQFLDVHLLLFIYCHFLRRWHGSLNVPIEHHPTIRYMVYNGYYKVMSNIPKMGQLPTPGWIHDIPWSRVAPDAPIPTHCCRQRSVRRPFPNAARRRPSAPPWHRRHSSGSCPSGIRHGSLIDELVDVNANRQDEMGWDGILFLGFHRCF